MIDNKKWLARVIAAQRGHEDVTPEDCKIASLVTTQAVYEYLTLQAEFFDDTDVILAKAAILAYEEGDEFVWMRHVDTAEI